MKKLVLASAMLGAMVTQAKEVTLNKIMTPEFGYDNNDHVEIVVDGELPNKCFQVGETKVLLDKATKNITITQLLEERDIPDCRQNSIDKLPNIEDYPIPFSKVVGVGRLIAGDYKIIFKTKAGLSLKNLSVTESNVATIDEVRYAGITDAFIPALNYSETGLSLILTGVIYNSCEHFQPQVKFERVGDVFIVLPKVTRSPDILCKRVQKPIQGIVNLGEIKEPGRYLIHIRSQSGVSVNKVFTVLPKAINLGF